ncbi:unnamed protein product [Nesidiocoris tenuis]|uniref:Uncharacterized protein n=1 Tax=Nesidiocoris tenuis TaxID=355587 RepID=A0A6H5G6D4_9HEMI|nr:unnamed protein product [Nesidiocoris tenuis]
MFFFNFPDGLVISSSPKNSKISSRDRASVFGLSTARNSVHGYEIGLDRHQVRTCRSSSSSRAYRRTALWWWGHFSGVPSKKNRSESFRSRGGEI